MICTLALTWGAGTMSSKAANTHAGFPAGCVEHIWVWVNTYRYIFSGMNIHLPAILMFTRATRFWPIPISAFFPHSSAASGFFHRLVSESISSSCNTCGSPTRQTCSAWRRSRHEKTACSCMLVDLVVWECANHVWTCFFLNFIWILYVYWVFSCLFYCNGVWMEIANHSESLEEWKEKLIQLLRRREAGQLWPIRSCPNVQPRPGAKWDEPWKEPWLDHIDYTSVTGTVVSIYHHMVLLTMIPDITILFL